MLRLTNVLDTCLGGLRNKDFVHDVVDFKNEQDRHGVEAQRQRVGATEKDKPRNAQHQHWEEGELAPC